MGEQATDTTGLAPSGTGARRDSATSAAPGSLSLRVRFALVSGVVAALVAVTLGMTYFALLTTTGFRQLDRTVSTMNVQVAQPGPPPPVITSELVPNAPVPLPPPPNAPMLSLPLPNAPMLSPPPAGVLVTADGVVAAVDGAPGLRVRLSPDRDAVVAAIHRSQLIGVAIAVGGVVVAAVLGWFLAGYAARPLRRLAAATHGIDTLERLPPLSGRGAREAEELSDAITRMLARLEAAHAETQRALAGARDFAAVCAHELRTPLTAMRTDLQVLHTKELPPEQRRAVLSDVLLAEQQIESTLDDLERLAIGELTESDAFEPFELCETLDRAVQDARRRHPGVRVELTECAPTTVMGLAGGLMLIVTNAVANAVQHGQARTVTVAAHHHDGAVDIVIDDDGRGMPSEFGAQAFDRFVKGPGSSGSGLGLALVHQQAEIHSGTAELGPSPQGGVRLRVRIATTR